jgi:hypothetical protein
MPPRISLSLLASFFLLLLLALAFLTHPTNRDLQTGTVHPITSNLHFDVQSIYAPMGTYPSFAFSPSDDAILIWGAEGKIWRVSFAANKLGERVLKVDEDGDGEVKEVKFRADVELRIAETRRLKEHVSTLLSVHSVQDHTSSSFHLYFLIFTH